MHHNGGIKASPTTSHDVVQHETTSVENEQHLPTISNVSSSCASSVSGDQDEQGLADDEMEEEEALPAFQNMAQQEVLKKSNADLSALNRESLLEQSKCSDDTTMITADDGKTQTIQATITEKLLHQFYLETIAEMNIFDPFSSGRDDHTTMSNNNQEQSGADHISTLASPATSSMNRTPCEDLNENAIDSRPQLLSIKRELEHEISLIDSQLFDLNETEAFLSAALNRLAAENRINNALKDHEACNLEELKELSKIVEIEVEKKESSEQNKIISTIAENDSDNAFTNSSIAYNILQLQHLIDSSSKKLEDVQFRHNQLVQTKRRRMVEKAHLRELNNQSLRYEKKVNSDIKKIEDKYSQDLKKEQDESNILEATEKMLQFKMQFVTNEDGQQLMETMEKVMSMLKGREELPDGNYISVTRAINYYSQLKEAAEKNIFTVEYFKKFLREHKEFGVFACNFEDYYSQPTPDLSCDRSIFAPHDHGSTIVGTKQDIQDVGSETLEKSTTKYILDPTESLYNTREEMPKFEYDVSASSKTPLNKRSVNPSGTRINRSLSLSKSVITTPFTPSLQNVSSQSVNVPSSNPVTSKGNAQDVLRRSMNVLSKVQASKKSKH